MLPASWSLLFDSEYVDGQDYRGKGCEPCGQTGEDEERSQAGEGVEAPNSCKRVYTTLNPESVTEEVSLKEDGGHYEKDSVSIPPLHPGPSDSKDIDDKQDDYEQGKGSFTYKLAASGGFSSKDIVC